MGTHIGEKIRNLRKEKKMTLSNVAQETNLSISFLSQLEHGKTSATLESFKKVSEALGVNPSYFFQEEEPDQQSTIVRHNTHEIPLQASSFIYKDLTGQMREPLFSPILVILHPGDNRGNIFSHKGQEFLYVLEGTLTVLIEDQEYTLEPHDSIFIESSTPHYWKNDTAETVKMLFVSAAG